MDISFEDIKHLKKSNENSPNFNISKDWDKTFLEMVEIFSKHSKCAAKQVCCILVKNNAPISIGLNGTVPGHTNCNEIFHKKNGEWYSKNELFDDRIIFNKCEDQSEHHKWSKKYEVHAEINALAKAGKSGISTDNATAYINFSPCNACSLALISFGIKRVVFSNIYDKETDGLSLLRLSNVIVDFIEL